VRRLGAQKAFDYHPPECADDIKTFTKNKLVHVLNCISERGAPEICLKAMSDAVKGKYISIGPVSKEQVEAVNPNVEHTFVMGQKAFGQDIVMRGRMLKGIPEDLAFGRAFWDLSGDLLGKGIIKPHKFSVNEGGNGLQGVLGGLQILRERKASAKKLVYII
jgi:NADPH:quinone reductase-like Zn-dependent oxidoreductase